MSGNMVMCFTKIKQIGIILLLCSELVMAQASEQLPPGPLLNFIGISFSGVNPVGQFRTNTKALYPAFEMHYLRQFKRNSPVFWGLSTYYTGLGSRRAVITEFLDNTIIDFNYSTNSHLLGFNGLGRFYPEIFVGKAEFYAELLIGAKWFFTTTTKTIPDTDDSDVRIDKGNLALDYGIALGVNYPIYKSLYASLKSSYLPGTAGSYYLRNDKQFIEFTTLEGFTLKNSAVELIRWDFGVTFAF